MGEIFISTDGVNYEKLGTTIEVPKLVDSGIIDDDKYNKIATLGETEVSFKIRDKYYLIYQRTKKKRIKKKQLKRMNSIFATILSYKEYLKKYLKSVDLKDIEIKVEGKW